MRLLMVSAYYPSHGGGVELACQRLAADLASGGHRVRWMAQADGPVPEVPGAECCPFAGSDMIYRLTGIPLPLPSPGVIALLIRQLRWAQVVVIAEANFVISALAYLIARLAGARIVLVQHVGKPSTLSSIAALLGALVERLAVGPMLRGADRVVFVSPWVEAHFRHLRLGQRASVIGHAIDHELFRPASPGAQQRAARRHLGLPEEGPIACFVGRLTDSKGIAVVAQMARWRPDWTFAIAGTGPVDPEVWGLANVVTLGQLGAAQVARLYQSSAVLLLPSQSESFSLVVREAMASGCEVICAPQILKTDPRLGEFLHTAAVDLADPARTAERFLALLDSRRPVDVAAGRRHILGHCAPEAVRRRYLEVVGEVVPQALMAASL